MKKRFVWISIIALVILFIVFQIYRSTHKAQSYTTYTVATQDIRQTVLATGTVTSKSDLDLGFENSGTVTNLNVDVGSVVHQGQVLAQLDQKDASASLSQAKAAVLSAQAAYDKLAAGSSVADINVSQSAVNAAQVALDNAKSAYNTTVQQQQVAVNNAYSAMLNSGLAATPAAANSSTASVSVSGTYTGTDEGSYVLRIIATGAGYSYDVSGLETYDSIITRGVPLQLGNKGLYITFSSTGTLSAGDSWTISIPNTQASTYLTNYNAYQTALQSQTQALANEKSAVDSAQAALQQAQAALQLKQSPARPEDIEAAKAQLLTAKAQLQTAQNNYDNDIIYAPIDGVITSVDMKIGEQVSALKEALVMLDQSSLHVESDIAESSIASVKPGQNIDMTLDAFGPDQHFDGQVLSIDPASTVVSGVVSYRVVSSLPNNSDIKPGMTVNLSIIAADKPNVIAVPNRLIKSSGNRQYVTILEKGKTRDVDVQTGLAGDTYTEIISGLKSGDQVVEYTNNK